MFTLSNPFTALNANFSTTSSRSWSIKRTYTCSKTGREFVGEHTKAEQGWQARFHNGAVKIGPYTFAWQDTHQGSKTLSWKQAQEIFSPRKGFDSKAMWTGIPLLMIRLVQMVTKPTSWLLTALLWPVFMLLSLVFWFWMLLIGLAMLLAMKIGLKAIKKQTEEELKRQFFTDKTRM